MLFMYDISFALGVCYTRLIMQKTYVWDTDFVPKYVFARGLDLMYAWKQYIPI